VGTGVAALISDEINHSSGQTPAPMQNGPRGPFRA
jgi:hypothetical protein